MIKVSEVGKGNTIFFDGSADGMNRTIATLQKVSVPLAHA
jgi:hypothetical protein